MAHKKAGGSTSLGRDSISKRLGIKIHDGQFAKAGAILARQRGTRYRAGDNVEKGGDDTLFATIAGFVKISSRKVKRFTGALKEVKTISVVPEKK